MVETIGLASLKEQPIETESKMGEGRSQLLRAHGMLASKCFKRMHLNQTSVSC